MLEFCMRDSVNSSKNSFWSMKLIIANHIFKVSSQKKDIEIINDFVKVIQISHILIFVGSHLFTGAELGEF